MMYIKCVLEYMELQVEITTEFYIDKAVDLDDNWSAGGRNRHMETKIFFLRNLKEAGIL